MAHPPFVAVTDAKHPCVIGWDDIAAELQRAVGRGRIDKPILVVDCYPGVHESTVLQEITSRLASKLVIHAADAWHAPEKIEKLVVPQLVDEKSRPGRLSALSLVNFFDAEPLWRFRRAIDELKEGLVLIVGCGASLVAWGHILVYAGLARRTATQRLAHPAAGNLGADNLAAPADAKCRRARRVDWPVADRWKRPLINRWDYVLDTNHPAAPKLADADDVRSGMREAVTRPFRLVPAFFDPAPGAGPRIEPGSGLNGEKESGFCFDSAPEENSLLLGFGDTRFEIPAVDLLLYQPRALLGEAVHLRYGERFPIRLNRVETNAAFQAAANGNGWREEKTRLSEGHLIEMRRHWFTQKVPHDTGGSVNVLKLVAGEEAVVESPADAFAPFVVHHAETFIVPAAVGPYAIRPHGPSAGQECATIKAFVPPVA